MNNYIKISDEWKQYDWSKESRWNHLKRHSNYHFDESRAPVPGHDSYTYVGNFADDFDEAIKTCSARCIDFAEWAQINSYDFNQANVSPDFVVYSRTKVDDIPVLMNIEEQIGMHDCHTRYNLQRLGQTVPDHIDDIFGRNTPGPDPHPEEVRRFVIMLDDWHRGQIFQVGNASWTNWKKGDCITWEWNDMPHSTCNFGWADRPMLQITGYMTDKSRALLSKAEENLNGLQ